MTTTAELIARHTYTSTWKGADAATIADLVKWLSYSPNPYARKAADTLAAQEKRIAEKDARIAELERKVQPLDRERWAVIDRAEKAEARVAELERTIAVQASSKMEAERLLEKAEAALRECMAHADALCDATKYGPNETRYREWREKP